MTRVWLGPFAAGVLAAGALAAGQGQAPAAQTGACTFTVQQDVPATMRDGTVLKANVYTPDPPGQYPVIMIRLPYNKDRPMTNTYGQPDVYASHCYIVVSQDVRGQYKSDGVWYPFRNEANDGYDTIEWAAKLPKSSGRVGMYGRSYPGATQWLPAMLRPPHLTAIVPAMTSSDYRDGWTYEGGALDQAFAEDWPGESIAKSAMQHYPDGAALAAEFAASRGAAYMDQGRWFLPLSRFPTLHPDEPRIAGYFYDWLRHPDADAYWEPWSIRQHWSQITVPALNFEGWYDIFLNGGIENFAGMRKEGGSKQARDGQRLVVGPWIHLTWQQKVGQLDFGPEAVNPMQQLMLRWYDHWLKGMQNGVESEPRVRLFVMGANMWRTANEWPVEGTAFHKYYLHSDGRANTAGGDGRLDIVAPSAAATPDHYSYDSKDPVPSVGGRFMSVVPGGPYDQRPVLNRPDVLVYTTDALEHDVEVTGPIAVSLYAASSAPDTDFTAKLDDVYPDGTSMLVTYGIQRARYRESASHPTLIVPGRTYAYTIHVWPTSNLFKAGHRIRLEISSSNFPMWDRNPNTGHAFGQDAELAVAQQTIFHDRDHPSAMTLPIVSAPIK